MILFRIMAGIQDSENLLNEFLENDDSTDDEIIGTADDTVCIHSF